MEVVVAIDRKSRKSPLNDNQHASCTKKSNKSDDSCYCYGWLLVGIVIVGVVVVVFAANTNV